MAKHASVKITMDKDLKKFLNKSDKEIQKIVKGKATQISCPKCGKKMTATIGKKKTCSKCKETFEITA